MNNKPVAVLSNNDGCIVSRSQEIKDLKIPMGAPGFKYEGLIKKHGGTLLSSNYALYARYELKSNGSSFSVFSESRNTQY